MSSLAELEKEVKLLREVIKLREKLNAMPLTPIHYHPHYQPWYLPYIWYGSTSTANGTLTTTDLNVTATGGNLTSGTTATSGYVDWK